MEFIPAVAMTALIIKIIDFLRYATDRDGNGVLTQLFAWAAGAGGLLLVAQTTWAGGIDIGGQPLSKLGVFSLVFAGLTLGSAASLVKDTLKSIDNTDSTKIPTLLAPRTTPTRSRKDAG